MAKTTGIRERNGAWEAWVFDKRAPQTDKTGKPKTDENGKPLYGKKIRRTFKTLAAAKNWRADATVGVRKRTLRAPTQTTLAEAWTAWLAGARDGSIRNRSGDRYKPSVIRSYGGSMRRHVLHDYGAHKLSDLGRLDLQDLADRMLAAGRDPSTIRNALMPVRVVFRRAVERGELDLNPATGIRLPAVRGRRERFASPEEAAQLLAALPDDDRAAWAVACYAGLRLGEIRALTFDDVDLEAGVIRVYRSWDPHAGPIEPKSRAGTRDVPIVAALRVHLAAHLLRHPRRSGFLFGSETTPFSPRSLSVRAEKTWTAAKLRPIGWHELRHTCASIFIAAGVNAKALSSYLGHSSITITLDRYGHLMPGSEDEAVALVDAYLERSAGARNGASGVQTAQLRGL